MMLPIMNEIKEELKNDLTSLKETVDQQYEVIKCLNETVSHDVDCCGGTGGWRRVLYLDMTDPNTNCPSGWSMTNYNIRTCGRASDGYYDTCDSVFFPVSGGEYSQVCGKLKAYQWARVTAGFWILSGIFYSE